MNGDYAKLDFGTKPTTVSYDTIDVQINPEVLVESFSGAYVNELTRRNPVRADSVLLDKDELYYYFQGLIAIRVLTVRGENKVWREAKMLYIPAWIETVMSMIGKVVDVDHGLVLNPVYDFTFDMKEMFRISEKLRAFLPDGVVLHRDAFPREVEGDKDVMAMAIIDGYVHGMNHVHPIASYIAAFLGFKLVQEANFKILYRVRYDDVQFITNMILQEEGLR